jgi:hypothetical protein
MNFPTRKIDHFELTDLLRDLEKFGVEVPMLQNSNYAPEYVKTTEDGVEVYRHAGRTVQVHAGEAIDSHGNIINLQRLQTEAFGRITRLDTDRTPVDDRYADLTITLIPSLGEPRDKRKVSVLDVDRLLHPETHPDFSKPTVREYIE